jgi:hypothetical protein
MKLSYAIPVKDEFIEIQRLITYLLENKDNEDEIVVLWDSKNGDPEIETYLRAMNVGKTLFRWYSYEFDGHFANMKNHLNSLCTGDWIVQLDADEMVTETFMFYVKESIKLNPEMHLFIIPRINTVEGLTQEHINRWGWRVNENGWVNFPDPQQRVYINNDKIRWKNKVHEQIIGHERFGMFPSLPEVCIQHHKDIARQERQNSYYETL